MWREHFSAGADVIVLTRKLAEKLYGDANPVGRRIRYSGFDYLIVGVIDRWNAVPRAHRLIGKGAFDNEDELFLPMASAVRQVFHHNRAAFPYVDTTDEREAPEWLSFVRQLGNMKAEPTKASYSSFKMADAKIGDDLFDAACAAVYALITRGLADAPTTIQHRRVSREQLLGLPGSMGAIAGAIARLAANEHLYRRAA